jgi:hypothetical protein
MMLGQEITPMDRWLQYGALGLCALMVIFSQWNANRMAKALDAKDKRTNAIAENAVRFIQRCCDLLDDRPCLYGHVKGRDALNGAQSEERK